MSSRNVGHIDEMALANGVAAGSVIKRMAPGVSGTRRLAERFGQSLVCVRYRENPARGLRYTTVGSSLTSIPSMRRKSWCM